MGVLGASRGFSWAVAALIDRSAKSSRNSRCRAAGSTAARKMRGPELGYSMTTLPVSLLWDCLEPTEANLGRFPVADTLDLFDIRRCHEVITSFENGRYSNRTGSLWLTLP